MRKPGTPPNDLPPDERPINEGARTYPDGTAGRLMQSLLVKVPDHWMVGAVIDYCRESADLPDDVYDIFVVDADGRLRGSLPLGRMMRTKRPAPIMDIVDTDIPSVPTTAKQTEVARLFRDQNLVSCPVVDEAGRLQGVIMVDDVVDAIDEEAEANLLEMGGTIVDGIWRLGPPEPQELAGLRFRQTSSNHIDLDPTPSDQSIRDTPSRREVHSEVRSAGLMLNEMFERNGSYSNQFNSLYQTTADFLESLGASPAELKPALAVVRGNGLRIELELDQRRQAAADPDRDQMSEGVFAALQRVVETWNIYISMDPLLNEIDSARQGPGEHGGPIDYKAAGKALASAKEFATPEAVDEIQRIEAQSQQATASGRRAQRSFRATWRNLVRIAIKVVAGAGSAVGATYVVLKEAVPILRWMRDQADFLRDVLVDSPLTLSALEWLLKILPPL